MTSTGWTAPAVERTEFPMVGGEREQLDNFIESHRETLLWKCAGLTAEQLKRRPVPPSTMSLLGLVRHMADVERNWFQHRIGGAPYEPRWKTPENHDADFDDVDDADAEEAFAHYAATVAEAKQVVVGRPLDETYTVTNRHGDTLTFDLRLVLLHMIEEYARHNGHADFLREQIDGSTGE